MLKQELRTLYLKKRKELPEIEKAGLNMKIKSQFEQYLPDDIKTVHVFLPIKSNGEIDTWPIIEHLWSKNIRVVVPVIEQKKLNSYLLSRDTNLKVNGWKIPEPQHSTQVPGHLIDAVVLPLLAFDMYGYRVGYGKGFYDAYLSSLPEHALKIGLSYFPAIDKISDPDPWDIPLNVCITPDKLIKF